MITTTLKTICEAGPCDNGIRKLLKHLGKTITEAREDDTPLSVLTVLDINGVGYALWVLDKAVGNKRICRLFAVDCAERVHHLFAAVRPDDDRPMNAIRVARDPNATDKQRAAAGSAAEAAARAAAGAAGSAGTSRAARNAARAAARAARNAWAAGAAWAAEAAEASQTARLRQYLTYGEAAADMPWPEIVGAS